MMEIPHYVMVGDSPRCTRYCCNARDSPHDVMPQDAAGVLRQLCAQKRQPLVCRDRHPHLLVEAASFSTQDGQVQIIYTVYTVL